MNPLYVTVHPPTSVIATAKGAFIDPEEVNLIVCKHSVLDVYTLTPSGLELVKQQKLFGNVTHMHLVHPPSRPTALLFLSTRRHQYAVLSWNKTQNAFRTELAGSLHQRNRHSFDLPMSFADPLARMAALALYQGELSIVPLDTSATPMSATARAAAAAKGKLKASIVVPDPFQVRLSEINVISIVGIEAPLDNEQLADPMFAVLFQDPNEQRHVRTYSLSIKQKDLAPGPIRQVKVSHSANKLIPVPSPVGGFLVVDESEIMYCGSNEAVPPSPVGLLHPFQIECWSLVDRTPSLIRFIIGDIYGNFSVLFLYLDHNDTINSMKLQFLGKSTVCTSLTYLDSGYVFMGSHNGDSQLIQIQSEPLESGSYLLSIDVYPNLGPITDFVVMDAPGRDGGGQLVTCSGAYRDGSLRTVRHGIEINQDMCLPVSGGVSRIFALGQALIAFTSRSATTFLVPNAEGVLEQSETLPLRVEATLALEPFGEDLEWISQVTVDGIYIYSHHNGQYTSKAHWSTPDESPITDAVIFGENVLVAYKSCITGLSWTGEILEITGEKQFPNDVSSVDFDPTTQLAAASLWDKMVYVLSITELSTVAEYELDTLEARSVMLFRPSAVMELPQGPPVLVCARGDGSIVVLELNVEQGTLSKPRKMAVGLNPVRLARFTRDGEPVLVACCDRPMVLSSRLGRLVYSALNVSDTMDVCGLSIPGEVGGVAIATKSSIIFGSMNAFQHCDIKGFPLFDEKPTRRHFMPRRIAHLPVTQSLVVLVDAPDLQTAAGEASFVKLFDEMSMEVLDTFALKLNQQHSEMALSICTHSIGSEEMVIVGTAFVNPAEQEPTSGRILIFHISSSHGGGRKLTNYIQFNVQGAVYSLASMGAGSEMIVAGINTRVAVFKVPHDLLTADHSQRTRPYSPQSNLPDVANDREPSPEVHNTTLEYVCHAQSFITVIQVETRGHFVVVADLMRSVTLLIYRPDERKLEVLARDPAPSWTTACAAIDDDTIVATDADLNLYIAERNVDVTDDRARKRLILPAEIHIGEHINRIRSGKIHPVEPNAVVDPRFLLGAVSGHLGVLCHVEARQFKQLLALQQSMIPHVEPVGNFAYSAYREFSNDRRTAPVSGIIDGDLVSMFASDEKTFSPKVREMIVNEVNANIEPEYNLTVDEALALTEEVYRLM